MAGLARRAARTVPVAWALFLVLAVTAIAWGGTSRRLAEANEARRVGRVRQALEGYREVLAELGDRKLPGQEADLRLHALRSAADVCYLELGDFTQAVHYYRRIVALYPGTGEALQARSLMGDIYLERMGDRVGAIAQWEAIASSEAPEAASFQLKVAKAYLDLGNFEQARTEARIARERWAGSPVADEALLLIAQAWTLERRNREAESSFEALLERRPPSELAAQALAGQAQLAAQEGKFERAIDLYHRALDAHPNPETIRFAIDRVRERRHRAQPTVRPGDRTTAFDHAQSIP